MDFGAVQDLDQAQVLEDANVQARDALNSLNTEDLRELKSFQKPPELIKLVVVCVLKLMCNVNPQVPTKNGKLDEFNVWSDALKIMKSPAKFIDTLLDFTEKVEQFQVPESNFKSVRSTIEREEFDPNTIYGKSRAAAGLCQWVLSIVAYRDIQNQVYQVEPEKKKTKVKKAGRQPETIQMNLQDFDEDDHENNPADTPIFHNTPEDDHVRGEGREIQHMIMNDSNQQPISKITSPKSMQNRSKKQPFDKSLNNDSKYLQQDIVEILDQVNATRVDNLPVEVVQVISKIVEKRVSERLEQEMCKFQGYLDEQMGQQKQANRDMIGQRMHLENQQKRKGITSGNRRVHSMQFNTRQSSEGYMTYKPVTDKVDGSGYVMVKPTAMMDPRQNAQGPQFIQELGGDPYYRYHRPHHYNWRMGSFGHEPPFYPYQL